MLKRFATMMGVVGLLGLTVGLASAFDDEKPTIKKAMSTLHGKSSTNSLKSVQKAVNADEPDWKTIKAVTKVIATTSAAIVDLDPPRGDKEHYTKLSKEYASTAKGLREAADKEDAAAVKGALKKLNNSCKACHNEHQEKK